MKHHSSHAPVRLGGIPSHTREYVVSIHAKNHSHQKIIYIVDKDDLATTHQNLAFFCPNHRLAVFPPRDMYPYETLNPTPTIMAQRIQTLGALIDGTVDILVTTIEAFYDYVVPREQLAHYHATFKTHYSYDRDTLLTSWRTMGYQRVDTVLGVGDYAVRGGIIDLFPVGSPHPIRLDFLGDVLESIKTFDPLSQRTTDFVEEITYWPLSEIVLTDANLQTFRQNYRLHTPLKRREDIFYEAIQNRNILPGTYQWTPFFYAQPGTFLDYIEGFRIISPSDTLSLAHAYWITLTEHYESRKAQSDSHVPYAFAPETLFVPRHTIETYIEQNMDLELYTFEPRGVTSAHIHVLHTFRKRIKSGEKKNLLDFREHIKESPKPIIVTAPVATEHGHLRTLMRGMGFPDPVVANSWNEVILLLGAPISKKPYWIIVPGPLAQGFETSEFELYTETDLLGQRAERISKVKPKISKLLELSHFQKGDFLVHDAHGIGRFENLETLSINDAPHDCIRLTYDQGDRLFVPVENMDILSFFAHKDSASSLDKLGSSSWQQRKERVRKKIKEIAEKLATIAATRSLIQATPYTDVSTDFQEFCARFPYMETDDQLNAINDVLSDLANPTPMDRLVCGDVGFGKTEVALRAAFVVASSGAQVVVLAPTTLLARQHYESFMKRFSGLGFQIGLMSRFQNTTELKKQRKATENGSLNILIGTHSLLSSRVTFYNLGLLIIDEEQHFGVQQKEKIKAAYPHIHVLSLSATPIPRTLQLSISGIRDLSLITTPPLKRLPVKTRVMPFDILTIADVLQKEKSRGGQSFFVCPHVSHIPDIYRQLSQALPDLGIGIAHGQLTSSQLENTVIRFCEGAYDILVSTNIVESGLDIPNANTLIVYRSDLFGLAQLYQLRGRVGRSPRQGYAYFTITPEKTLTTGAERRLEVMQTLESLGASFQVASHDMDIRGTGNILGEEQSGQMQQVGIGMYHHMLEEALMVLKAKQSNTAVLDHDWSPQINIGLKVFIPETYIPDMTTRLSIYQQIATIKSDDELIALQHELVDRFGPLPPEASNLARVIQVKNRMKELYLSKIDTGPKGILFSFHQNTCPYVDRLVTFSYSQKGTVQLRPDQKMVLYRAWDSPESVLSNVTQFLTSMKESVLS